MAGLSSQSRLYNCKLIELAVTQWKHHSAAQSELLLNFYDRVSLTWALNEPSLVLYILTSLSHWPTYSHVGTLRIEELTIVVSSLHRFGRSCQLEVKVVKKLICGPLSSQGQASCYWEEYNLILSCVPSEHRCALSGWWRPINLIGEWQSSAPLWQLDQFTKDSDL